mmetsp:Transcript_13260/g.19072  ORF Transcript_13260/g.19072 Transcript_13260/m.19072 type:complete len:182 (+) Transcript_13260:952-1497(+)
MNMNNLSQQQTTQMQGSFRLMIAIFLIWTQLTNAFVPSLNQNNAAQIDSQLEVGVSLDASHQSLFYDPLRESVMDFSLITNDEVRREAFEEFILYSIRKEEARLVSWRKDRSCFVRKMDRALGLLGQTVQNGAWDTYVVGGFQRTSETTNEQAQLWACVDMLVQFKTVVCRYDMKGRENTL